MRTDATACAVEEKNSTKGVIVLLDDVKVPFDQSFILLSISTTQHQIPFGGEKPIEFLKPMYLSDSLQITFDFLCFKRFGGLFFDLVKL